MNELRNTILPETVEKMRTEYLQFLQEEVFECEWNTEMFWYPRDVAKLVVENLKKQFPGHTILSELFKIDHFVLEANIPVEVQRTPVNNRDKGGIIPSIWINVTRRQLEWNINMYGTCWLYFDRKFLIYLQKGMARNNVSDFRWLYDYLKDGKVKLFTIDTDNGGKIDVVSEKDFTFLRADEDIQLEINRSQIVKAVLRKTGFIREAEDIYNRYISEKSGNPLRFKEWLLRQERTQREREYIGILFAFNNIYLINDAFNCKADDKRKSQALQYGITLGLFQRNGRKGNMISLIDKYNVGHFFPGYFNSDNNKKFWDYLRSYPIDIDTFYGMITGKARPESYPVKDNKFDSGEIVLPAKTIGSPNRKFKVDILKDIGRKRFNDLCKKHPLYHLRIRTNPPTNGGSGAGKPIPINTLGKWLFGVQGYQRNMKIDEDNGEICLPKEAPDEAEKMIIDIIQQ